jgi:hypothetical protein
MENAAPAADEPEFTYRPLVAKGEDRAARLAEVIERWARESKDCLGDDQGPQVDVEKLRKLPSALVGYDFRDDNEGANSIDLGKDLLKPLSERLRAENGDESEEPYVVVVIVDCRIRRFDAVELDAPFHFVLIGDHSNVRSAYLHKITFAGFARFDSTTFSGDAWFDGASFNSFAGFWGTTFSGVAGFEGVTFGGEAEFDCTTFCRDAGFDGTNFIGDAYFHGARFEGSASFGDATFSGLAWFEVATFVRDAWFGDATFSKEARFGDATFRRDVGFSRATFIGEVDCENAAFKDKAIFYGCDLRRAGLAWLEIPLRVFPPAEQLRLALTDRVNWQLVRNFGKLTVLTKASYLALVAIPLLAGMWVPLRRGILWINGALADTNASLNNVRERLEEASPVVPAEVFATLERVGDLLSLTLHETMPLSWLLAFMAALAVAVAHFVYEVRAPQLIRDTSEEVLVERAYERNRIDGEITYERLREAIGYLHEAAEQLPHRHSAWFVKRHKRTVWIPDNLDHFKSARIDEAKPDNAPEGWEPRKIDATDQEVQPEDRKRNAIEAGQRARYSVAAFENRKASWVSGGLYSLAIWLLLMIVCRQLGHIAYVSPATWLAEPFYLLSCGSVVLLGAVAIFIATVCGTLLVHDPTWWKWVNARLRLIRSQQSYLTRRLGLYGPVWGRAERQLHPPYPPVIPLSPSKNPAP